MKTKIKTIRIIILLMIVFSACIGNVDAQINVTFEYDSTPFIGKWESKSGNQTFELIITEYRYYLDEAKINYMDLLLGEIVYKRDGVATRHIKTNGFRAMLTVYSSSIMTPSQIEFSFVDEERKMAGKGKFTIASNTPQKAFWELMEERIAVEIGRNYDDWNKVGFDIPTELEWTKIE